MESKTRIILVHVIGCITFLTLPILFAPGPEISWRMVYSPPTQRELFSNLLMILFFYFNTYLLIPKLYFNKKLIWFGVILLICYLLITLVPHTLIEKNFQFARMRPPGDIGNPERIPEPQGHFIIFILSHNLLRFLVVFFVSMTIRISAQWRSVHQEKIKTELSFLKAQINPHFLFNTLNSIYSLAIQKSDSTASAVVKLSDMMRYVLGEAEKELVSLEKEITYIRDYIDLQKIRFGNSVQVSFLVDGNIKGKKIAPLILITFIENAFKYGVNTEEDSEIRIYFQTNENKFVMDVVNNKVKGNFDADHSSGMGLTNTRERLKLMYAGQHVLRIEDTHDLFRVKLSLTLK